MGLLTFILGLAVAFLFMAWYLQKKMQAADVAQQSVEHELRLVQSNMEKLQKEQETTSAKLTQTEADLAGKTEELTGANEKLAEAETQAEETAGKIKELEAQASELEGAKKQLEESQAQLKAKDEELESVNKKVTDLESELESARSQSTAAAPDAASTDSGDDLTKIEGIGPKVAEILTAQGISTFAILAESEVDKLQAILDEAGPNFKLAEPTTWPRQAKLAADGQWEALEQLQDELDGGKETE